MSQRELDGNLVTAQVSDGSMVIWKETVKNPVSKFFQVSEFWIYL